jgi:hypothetical protein
LEKAYLDLKRNMAEHGVEDPWQCLNLMVFEECFDMSSAVQNAPETGN